MADERDEIRTRVNIVDLVGQVVNLKRTGKTWKGLCPFHADKNPSFTVDPTFGTYRCWSCGEHGDVFTWVMKQRHLEFPEALAFLADVAGVTLTKRGSNGPSKSDKTRWLAAMDDALAFFRERLAKSKDARAYCERRGLSDEVLDYWEIGYAPEGGDALATYLKKNGHSLMECKSLFLVDEDSVGGYFDKFRSRLIFPIRDEAGNLVAFGGRLLGDGHPKYINSGDTPLYRKSKVLYGMNKAKDGLGKEKRAVLVEGYLDVMACHSAGVTGALASLGTSLAEDHARLLKRWCDSVVILYDSDAAGQKAADRAVAILQGEGLKTRVALMPPGEDPDTLLRTAGPAAVQQAVEAGLRPIEYKVRKLLATTSPEQEDDFWPSAVEILATSATNEMELDKYVVKLASMYPGVTDALSAQKALRAQVMRFRKEKARAREDDPPPRPMNPFKSLQQLKPPEIAIFGALLQPGMRQLAWATCGNVELFLTETGRQLAESIRLAFPEGPPSGAPAAWVNHIEPEELRDTFMVAQYDPRLEQMTPQYLEDSIATMRREHDEHDVSRLRAEPKTDESLIEIHNRLRKLKGQSE